MLRFTQRILLPILLILIGEGIQLRAQTDRDTDTLKVYFRQGSSQFDPEYRQNGSRLETFCEDITYVTSGLAKVVRVEYFGVASPEGTHAFNDRLSRKRAAKVIERLHSVIPFEDSLVVVHSVAEDWKGLEKFVENDLQTPDRDAVLQIIRGSDSPEREGELRRLNGSRAWNYLYRKYFNESRYCRIIVQTELCVNDLIIELEEDMEIEDVIVTPDTIQIPKITPLPLKLFTDRLTLKTNLFGWGLGHANIAVEYDVIPHLSVAVPFYYSGGFDYFKETLKFRGIVLQPEVRYYPWLQQGNNGGFYVGAHFGLGWYNFALNGEFRIQDHKGRTPAYGGGLGLGYSLNFKKNPRWGVEFAIGAGVYDVKYDTFYNEINGPYAEYGVHDTFIGIDNASIAFTYRFDFDREGGKR